VVSVEHIGEDDLERYAMRTLPKSACAALEEHLLTCQLCQDRLEAEIEYVAAMRAAAVRIRESGNGSNVGDGRGFTRAESAATDQATSRSVCGPDGLEAK